MGAVVAAGAIEAWPGPGGKYESFAGVASANARHWKKFKRVGPVGHGSSSCCNWVPQRRLVRISHASVTASSSTHHQRSETKPRSMCRHRPSGGNSATAKQRKKKLPTSRGPVRSREGPVEAITRKGGCHRTTQVTTPLAGCRDAAPAPNKNDPTVRCCGPEKETLRGREQNDPTVSCCGPEKETLRGREHNDPTVSCCGREDTTLRGREYNDPTVSCCGREDTTLRGREYNDPTVSCCGRENTTLRGREQNTSGKRTEPLNTCVGHREKLQGRIGGSDEAEGGRSDRPGEQLVESSGSLTGDQPHAYCVCRAVSHRTRVEGMRKIGTDTDIDGNAWMRWWSEGAAVGALRLGNEKACLTRAPTGACGAAIGDGGAAVGACGAAVGAGGAQLVPQLVSVVL